jgi:cytochrome d ubiquinol oxidase subunit II
VADKLWRAAWDFVFALASFLLALFFGTALGNLVRGVPLTAAGWFTLPLFTSFSPVGAVGILDWYTVGAGLMAVAALGAHGAAFLVWRTDGEVQRRARQAANRLFLLAEMLWVALFFASNLLNDVLRVMSDRAFGWLGVALAIGGIVSVHLGLRSGRELMPFLGTSAFLAGTLVATAACLFPVMLKSISDPALSITAYSGGGDKAGLQIALGWLGLGLPLVVGYFVVNYRLHRGKATAARDGGGY